MSETQSAIESSMQENRLFPPPAGFAAKAWIKSRLQYDQLYRQSIDQPDRSIGAHQQQRPGVRGDLSAIKGGHHSTSPHT